MKRDSSSYITNDQLTLRTLLGVAGMLLAGVAVGFFKRADLGLDPYQCFANGLNNLIPLSYGTFYMLLNIFQLVFVFFLDRHYIGISTFLNLFLLGYAADLSETALRRLFPGGGLPEQLIFMAIALILSCIAAALYYTADLGVSTYDAIPLHIADGKPHVFGRVLSFKYVRIICDLICVIIGVLTGQLPGIGTILTAFFMGPLITFFRRRLSDPILKRAKLRDKISD